MRFGRLAVETIFDKDSFTFEIGKAQRLCEGTDITIVSTGLTTSICLEAVKLLGNSGVSARFLNMASIKPIDKEQIILAAKDTGCILTVEEHNIIGGLGSAVAEVVCENYPCPVLRHGIYDTFGKSGKATDLLIDFGFTPEVVAEKAKQAMTLKK